MEKDIVEVEVDSIDTVIPLASNTQAGIARFNKDDFSVDGRTGEVTAKTKYSIPQYIGTATLKNTDNGEECYQWSVYSASIKPLDKVEIGDIILLLEEVYGHKPGTLFKIISTIGETLTSTEPFGYLPVYSAGNLPVVQEPSDSSVETLSAKALKKYYAPLEDGMVPFRVLPSYVLEYNSKSDFPANGEIGKIYIDKSTNFTYRWSGSMYIQVSAGDLNLENGTGDVLIQTTDSNQSFKVMTDGRAKVRSAPVEDDDVVRNKELAERSFAYYSIEAETARDYTKGSKIDKMFKDILKRLENLENKSI